MATVVCTIPLYARDGSVRAHALVDAEDYDALSAHRWHLGGPGYAVRFKDRRAILMHRAVFGLQPGDGIEVDHINRNRLDNRRANLRTGTRALNRQNLGSVAGTSSQYRGVTRTANGRWAAQAQHRRKRYHLGVFDREEDAARAAADFRAKHMAFSVEAA